MPPELSVVVPVHNEADNLSRLTGEIRRALEGRVDYEIVYVDDGSDDGSAEGLARLAGEESRIKVVRQGKRTGQSAAIASGVRAARAPWIATLDGDGQNDPADILPMLDMVRNPSRPSAPPPLRRSAPPPDHRQPPPTPRPLGQAAGGPDRQCRPEPGAGRRNSGHRLRPQTVRAVRFHVGAALRSHASLSSRPVPRERMGGRLGSGQSPASWLRPLPLRGVRPALGRPARPARGVVAHAPADSAGNRGEFR